MASKTKSILEKLAFESPFVLFLILSFLASKAKKNLEKLAFELVIILFIMLSCFLVSKASVIMALKSASKCKIDLSLKLI